MSAPLRIGFLVSGVLHMAVVAAFSLPTRPTVPIADEARPITLKLAVFQPPAEPVTEPAPAPPVVAGPPLETALPEPRLSAPPVAAEPMVVQPEPEPLPAAKPPLPSRRTVAEARRPRPPEKIRPAVSRQPAVEKADPSAVPGARPSTAPVVVAQTEPAGPVVPVLDVQATQHYLAALAARIDRSKFYPRVARRLGEEGMAVVGFVIQRNGELTDIHIVESSGHQRLDEAAIKTLRRVTPFRRIPEAIDRERWPITVPIAFSLRG